MPFRYIKNYIFVRLAYDGIKTLFHHLVLRDTVYSRRVPIKLGNTTVIARKEGKQKTLCI